jgi:hypothetical protein
VAETGKYEVRFASPSPEPSEIREWIEISKTDDGLADALIHYSGPGWYDLYKSIESLEDWAGGERALQALDLISRDELKRLKQTANSFRHRKSRHHKPPPLPMTLQQARECLRVLIRDAFASAQSKVTSRPA